jgi:hypothetical protein
MAGGASTWARRRSGDAQEPADDAQGASSASSVSSASEEPFWEKDDKFHLPPDHRPVMLLPGWDRPPAPPPEPDTGSGSDSGDSDSGSSGSDSDSGSSDSGTSSASSGSDEGDSGSPDSSGPPEQPPAPPQPVGFSCATCRYFKAQGNGLFGCENTNYQRYTGTDKLVESKSGRPVLNPMAAISDWWEQAAGDTSKPVQTRHNAGK